jgi:hypothetical protein
VALYFLYSQALTLRDDDNSDGWFWGDVRDALLAAWPECNMNNGATDCTLGSSQTQYRELICSTAATARGSWGSGAFSTGEDAAAFAMDGK